MILGLTIETAYHGPTNSRGARISATCKRDSDRTYRKFTDYRSDLDSSDNHLRAAMLLMGEIDADTDYEGAEPFRIVARGSGGRSDRGYHFIANRGGWIFRTETRSLIGDTADDLTPATTSSSTAGESDQ